MYGPFIATVKYYGFSLNLMFVKDLVHEIESSEAFSSWKSKNKGSLVHLFSMADSAEHLQQKSAWQAGYKHDNSIDITTFFSGQTVKLGPTSAAIDETASFYPIDMSKVEFDFQNAVSAATSLNKTELLKIIALLRGSENNPEWAITLFGSDYSIRSFLFDAKTLELKSQSEHSLKDLFQAVKGNGQGSDN